MKKRMLTVTLMVLAFAAGGVVATMNAQTSGPTITGGTGNPQTGDCTSSTVGSLYMRGTPAEGAAILYICRLVDANNVVYAWDAIEHNAEP
ncbi:MAG TPA: hypothetical protein VGD79_03505 [Thermoanaerobaculia bacterium]|jgi:hypothetical protein